MNLAVTHVATRPRRTIPALDTRGPSSTRFWCDRGDRDDCDLFTTSITDGVDPLGIEDYSG